MIEESDDLISEYYEQVKDKYNISLDHFKIVCKVPFLFFQKMMAHPDLPIIKIKYFGRFLIFPSTAKGIIKAQTEKFNRGEISEQEFIDTTQSLKRHSDEYEREDS